MEDRSTDWNIPEGPLSALKNIQTVWDGVYLKASNHNNRTSADVVAKNESRREYEKSLRGFIFEWLARNNSIEDSERERMGLTVRKTTHTAVPEPTTSPIGNIDFSIRRQHLIYFTDGLGGKGKPEGVHGCEIYYRMGEAGESDSEYTFLATETKSPYLLTFKMPDAGKMVYYMLRWVNTRGKPGPWSKVISAIVAP
ncbi:MAG TPA: hypothetical protein VIH57_16315 [Bacteroidales bacterium]